MGLGSDLTISMHQALIAAFTMSPIQIICMHFLFKFVNFYVYSVVMQIVLAIFVRFTIMKIKYIITILLVEYSTYRIYMMFLLIKCFIAAKFLS